MRRCLCVGVILLAMSLIPGGLNGQTGGEDDPPRVRTPKIELRQNYPNPFNPSTRIPFVLGDDMFEGNEPVVVSIRIFNVLQQLVAIPTALSHPTGNGVPVENLEYRTPGQKEAFWDGYDVEGRKAASGIYYLQLVVNGERRIMKMVVAK